MPLLRADLSGGLNVDISRNIIAFPHDGLSITGSSIIPFVPSASLSAADLVNINRLGTLTFPEKIDAASGLANIGSLERFGGIRLTATTLPTEALLNPSLTGLSSSGLGGVGLVPGSEFVFRRFDTTAAQQVFPSLHIGDIIAKNKAEFGAIMPSVLGAPAFGAALSNTAPTALTFPLTAPPFTTTLPPQAPGFPLVSVQTLTAEKLVPGNIPGTSTSTFTGGFALATNAGSPGNGTGVPNAFTLTAGSPVIYGNLGTLTDVGDRLIKSSPSVQGASDFLHGIHVPLSNFAGVDTIVLGSAVRVAGLVPSYNARVPSWDTSLQGVISQNLSPT